MPTSSKPDLNELAPNIYASRRAALLGTRPAAAQAPNASVKPEPSDSPMTAVELREHQIVNSEHALGQESYAKFLAVDTTLPAAQAIETLRLSAANISGKPRALANGQKATNPSEIYSRRKTETNSGK